MDCLGLSCLYCIGCGLRCVSWTDFRQPLVLFLILLVVLFLLLLFLLLRFLLLLLFLLSLSQFSTLCTASTSTRVKTTRFQRVCRASGICITSMSMFLIVHPRCALPMLSHHNLGPGFFHKHILTPRPFHINIPPDRKPRARFHFFSAKFVFRYSETIILKSQN